MVKVMVVDDNKDFTYTLEKSLKHKSDEYEITKAHSGQECLDKVHEDIPDIVLLDIMMPKMDGWAVAQILMPMHIPILIVTGKANLLKDRKGSLAKLEYLIKPIDTKELDLKIKQILKS